MSLNGNFKFKKTSLKLLQARFFDSGYSIYFLIIFWVNEPSSVVTFTT